MTNLDHATTLIDLAGRYLREAGDPVLAGHAAALERRLLNATVHRGEVNQTRREIQANGLALAQERAHAWLDQRRGQSIARCETLCLVEATYRLGVETGVDAVMAEEVVPVTQNHSTPELNLHTYTATPDGVLTRLDEPALCDQ